MNQTIVIAADLGAVLVLVFGIYFPRHQRRDLLVAFLVVNIGVLSVATALANTEASAGLGLGLFGVLSIIRLRSTELDQQEVAYYFGALSLGLLGGLSPDPVWLGPVLMAVIVSAIFVGDHPSLLTGYRNQDLTLEKAYTDETLLQSHLEELLQATVSKLSVKKVDLVKDTTTVNVRYKLNEGTK